MSARFLFQYSSGDGLSELCRWEIFTDGWGNRLFELWSRDLFQLGSKCVYCMFSRNLFGNGCGKYLRCVPRGNIYRYFTEHRMHGLSGWHILHRRFQRMHRVCCRQLCAFNWNECLFVSAEGCLRSEYRCDRLSRLPSRLLYEYAGEYWLLSLQPRNLLASNWSYELCCLPNRDNRAGIGFYLMHGV